MDRERNPYAPGAGLQPPELAGRNELIQIAGVDMDRVLGVVRQKARCCSDCAVLERRCC